MARTQAQQEALERNQYGPGETGNAGGRTKTKPISDALRALLAGDVAKWEKVAKPTQKLVEALYSEAVGGCAKSMSLILDRAEGSLPKPTEEKLMPTIEFHMHRLRALPAGPTSEAPREGTSLPSANGSESRIESKNGTRASHVVEVEAVPIDADDDEDEQDP